MLRAESLSKSFNNICAVESLGFGASPGEVFGILGPNGAGKTTTLRMLATTLKPTAGTATVAGADITREPETVRSRIGVLTASIGTYDRLTARENIRYFGRLHGLNGADLEERIEKVLSLLEMNDFADRRAGDFSTGMKQKVALARAVVHDPPVLIFDEPTSGLDVIASLTVTDFIKNSAASGKCVILSTHNMTLAQKLCGRALVIHHGRAVIDETIANILKLTGASLLEDAFLSLIDRSLASGVK